jgi:hypothetical protein
MYLHVEKNEQVRRVALDPEVPMLPDIEICVADPKCAARAPVCFPGAVSFGKKQDRIPKGFSIQKNHPTLVYV